MTLIYPGTFDPVTLGHLDIALRGAKIASRLIVAVLSNPHKTPTFSVQERVEFLKGELGSVNNIEIDSFSGLLAEYAKTKCATAIVRGLRSSADFDAEVNYATLNRLLSADKENHAKRAFDYQRNLQFFTEGGIETIYIPANPAYSFISSSAVREISSYIYTSSLSDTALSNLVTSTVQKALEKRFKNQD